MNFDKLLARYSDKGRKGYNPIMMYALIVYANMRGIRSVDKIVDLCKRDICFMWLAKGEKPERDAFYDFMNKKATEHIMENLHYQFVNILKKEGYVSLKSLFIDGTKIEANANRYTFVWRGSVNYHLSNLLLSIEDLFKRYNNLLIKNGYNEKYNLYEEEMFVIEGIDKIREIIKKNKERKLNKKNKISNNKIIEINNICLIKLLKLQENLAKISRNVLSEKGIVNRQIRSIQTEGHFGDIKENDGLRRFNHRSKEKNYKEMMFNIMGRNLNKYHRFIQGTLKEFEPKTA